MVQKKKQSKLSKELTTVTPLSKFLAMFLFIALPFIGFYLGTNYQNGSGSNAYIEQADLDMSDWQTFNSEKFKFSIKYPSNWTTHDPTLTGNFEESGVLNFHKGYEGIEVSLTIDSQSATTLQLQENSIRHYSWTNKKEERLLVDGISALRFTGNENGKDQSLVIFAKDGYIYKLQTVLINDLNLFNQIISSIRFTN